MLQRAVAISEDYRRRTRVQLEFSRASGTVKTKQAQRARAEVQRGQWPNLIPLCNLCVLYASVVRVFTQLTTTETQRTPSCTEKKCKLKDTTTRWRDLTAARTSPSCSECKFSQT